MKDHTPKPVRQARANRFYTKQDGVAFAPVVVADLLRLGMIDRAYAADLLGATFAQSWMPRGLARSAMWQLAAEPPEPLPKPFTAAWSYRSAKIWVMDSALRIVLARLRQSELASLTADDALRLLLSRATRLAAEWAQVEAEEVGRLETRAGSQPRVELRPVAVDHPARALEASERAREHQRRYHQILRRAHPADRRIYKLLRRALRDGFSGKATKAALAQELGVTINRIDQAKSRIRKIAEQIPPP